MSTTESAVRVVGGALDPSGNPNDPQVTESICYHLLAEPYMIENYAPGRQMYVGSAHESFRIHPARHSEVCGRYDHRRRSWFVAASTGPKDVVLVIDTSKSMRRNGRMDLARRAAKTVIDTLAVADHVAIVTFSDAASQVPGFTGLVRATEKNKKLLVSAVDALTDDKAIGGTNFYYPFDAAYNLLEQSVTTDDTSNCNAAVLFLTDGEIFQGKEEVIDLVNERTRQFANKYSRKVTVFTYSLGKQADHDVMKTIACNTNGIWTPVDDAFEDLISTMSSYYKLFAQGLGRGRNKDFNAWVEPYEFFSTKKMGTTVAVPFYDYSVNPALFLGVVATDMHLDTLEMLTGEDASSSEMLKRFIDLSTAQCPSIELTECELDALRYLGGGHDAVCGLCNSTDYVGIAPEKCPSGSDLPNNDEVWNNTDREC